jgi:hypothetical protein
VEAQVLTGLMERFGYRSLADARAESAEILRMTEIVRLGTPEREDGEPGGG